MTIQTRETGLGLASAAAIQTKHSQGLLSRTIDLVVEGLDRIKASRAEARAVRELQALSDHELRDIGMARGEIVSVVAAQHGRTERRRYARP